MLVDATARLKASDTPPEEPTSERFGHSDDSTEPVSRTRRLQVLTPTYLKACVFSLLGSATAQDNTSTCNFSLGQSKPGSAFAFYPWFSQGQCIRATGSFETCRNRLINVLANVDELHQTEYSASAMVLTLLPTIAALFGSPTSEIWALLKIFPPAGVLALFLSFGGSVFPTTTQDFLDVFKKQNVQSFTSEDEARAVERRRGGSGHVREGSVHADPLHDKLSEMLEGTEHHRLPKCSSTLLLTLGTVALFVLWASTMAGMAVVEQGAVYANWCTSKWWLHLWYAVVTVVTIFDAWIQLPFEERWTVYITERENLIWLDLPSGSDDIQHLLGAPESRASTSKYARHEVQHTFDSRPRDSTARTMLAVISVTTEDKHVPFWVTGLRLFSRAVGLVLFVFATSVFAQVSILALPMAQMILVLIMGGGLFGRAITSGVVSVIGERSPVLHVMTETREEADRLLDRLLQFRASGIGGAGKPVVFEVDGKALVESNCVGRRSPWVRRVFGLFATSVHGVEVAETMAMS